MDRKLIKYLWCLLVGLSYGYSPLEARHIVGGEITYELIDKVNFEYEFTMQIYRDSECQNCAFLDNPAEVAIYKCGSEDIECSLNQGDTFLRLEVPLVNQRSVAPPDYDCLQPPENIGVQEGTYTFRAVLPPDGKESYHIVYQRCCRNITINNIVNPQDAGATYEVEITHVSQDSLNSSPAFSAFPPTIICADVFFEFDHSAFDKDGDQLVYSFCSPKLGGGPEGTNETPGDPSSCNGVNPSPPCPPPYRNVSFINGTYSTDAPLGGDPLITIDPNTGIISGRPNIQGQFVVGVCVEEYRNGTLLGTIRRDFQFNVEACEIDSEAVLDADEIVPSVTPEGITEYIINLCGENTITFDNRSRQFSATGQEGSDIDNFYWEFDINGTITRFEDWEPTVSFPGTEGQFKGRLSINEGTRCESEASVTVNVYPRIVADFTYEYDTCRAGPVTFFNNSFSEGGAIVSNDWSLGDGNISTVISPEHTYRTPGNLSVNLTVTDVNNCQDTKREIISYFPVPKEILLAPDNFYGCAPADILFDNLSFPIDDTYDILWDFGDGNTSGELSPTNTYVEEGLYTVSLSIISPIGCVTDTLFGDLIEIDESPSAGFTSSDEVVSSIDPVVSFKDKSKDAVSWFWEFGEEGTSVVPNPTHTFTDTGYVEIKQTVTHINGCQDTFVKIIEVMPEVLYFLPNAFTPNNDGVNDVFRGNGVMDLASDFSFSIWDRYGELMFETNDPLEAWNGRKGNTGAPMPNGVYVYAVHYLSPRGMKKRLKGIATLLR